MSSPPLTEKEQLELERLLHKAAKAKSAAAMPPSGVSYHPADGMIYDPTTGAAYNVWDCEDPNAAAIAAMTDASKRREDMPAGMPGSKRTNMATGQPMYSDALVMPEEPPFIHDTAHLASTLCSPKTGLPPLPEGVENVEMWGKTVVKFGMYKDAGLSYIELATSQDDRAKGYLKWCRSRTASAQGQLRDYCMFLRHLFEQEQVTSALKIPGTDEQRVFKS